MSENKDFEFDEQEELSQLNEEAFFEEGIQEEEEQKVIPKKSVFVTEIYEWLEAVALSVVLVVLLFTFVFRIVVVDGRSMENTLHDTDRIIISNLLYKPAINDVVVFLPIIKQYENKPFVKRIIATEGQEVNVDPVNHKVFVDGKELTEPYVKELVNTAGDQIFPLKVPQGHVFVMGDNRNNSYDSRFTAVGTVDTRYILGRAVFRIFPLNKLGSINK